MSGESSSARALGCLIVIVLAVALGVGAGLAVKAARHHAPVEHVTPR